LDERYKIIFNTAVELGEKASEFVRSITDSLEGKIILGAGVVLIFWLLLRGGNKNL
jgi:hypothetical protein